MKKGKRLLRFVAMCLITTVINGCSNANEKTQSTNLQRKEKHELVIAIKDEPEGGFDSVSGGHGSLTRLLFSTLFKRNKNLEIENDLATEYDVSRDKLTWTIKIKENIKFTNGEILDSDDVVYTYNEVKKSGTNIDLTMLDSVEAIDKNTIKFKLTTPQSTFIEKMVEIGIMPSGSNDKNLTTKPVGSGPYQFVQWDKGQQVILKANNNYYGDKPNIEKLTMVFLDDAAAYIAVKSGDVDIASTTGTLATQQINDKKIIELNSVEAYGIEFPMVKSGKLNHEGSYIGNDITSDKSIRQAINYAINRSELVEGVLDGFGTISTTGLENLTWLNEETKLKNDGDVSKAKEILKSNGWQDNDSDGIVEKDGKKAEFKLIYTSGRYRQELALAVAKVAKEIGIDINLELKTWDNIEPEINSQAILFGWGSGVPSEIYNLYSSKILGQGDPWNNAGYYKNEKVDYYIDKALRSDNEQDALTYWKNAQWDGETGFSQKGDCTYAWLVNANHIYIADENLDIGHPGIQIHGGRIFDNICEWKWK